MDTINTTSATEQSFKQFLFHNRRNRMILFLAAAAIIIQFSIFKYLYPFASYIHGDSFSYINAAYENLTINTYLVGYSKFLRLVNIFAKPDYILVTLQYLLIQCSVLFLLFTIFYFYKPGRATQIILLCFMTFNPLFLHLANMISSDGLFLALSCTWFALLLWIIHRPIKKIIIWQAVVLFIAFTVRYNALIYPIIAGFAFWLSPLPLRKKLTGISLGLLLCGIWIAFTMTRYEKLTGHWQYAPFSGWQMANNAMYAYRHVDSADKKPVPKKFQALDNAITTYLNKARKHIGMNPGEQSEASTYYMWSRGMPLMDYRDNLFKKTKDSTQEFKKWASMGPLYKEYGIHLIKQYPWHYIRYFMWPNFRKYYAPPVEFLEKYNYGKNFVTPQTVIWFGYNNDKVKTRMANSNVWILNYYPILSGIINVIMLFGLIYYLILKGWQYNTAFNKTLLMAGTVWFINAGFTIFASSAALRFQTFPIILTSTFTLLLIDWMAQLARRMKLEEIKQKALTQSYNQEAIA